jgi:hypothetical protein
MAEVEDEEPTQPFFRRQPIDERLQRALTKLQCDYISNELRDISVISSLGDAPCPLLPLPRWHVRALWSLRSAWRRLRQRLGEIIAGRRFDDEDDW